MKIKDKRLTRNAVKCGKCGDVVESVHRHDFRYCKCGAIAVDGGLDYERRCGDIYGYTDLCEYEEYEREEYNHEREARLRREDAEEQNKLIAAMNNQEFE